MVFWWVGDSGIGCYGLGASEWCMVRKWKWSLLADSRAANCCIPDIAKHNNLENVYVTA